MQSNKAVENLSSNNLLIVLLLISFIVVGTTGLVSKTLIVGLIRDTKVLKAENKANDILDKNIEAAPKLVTAYHELGANSTRVLEDALPEKSNLPGLIVALENIANESNTSFKSIAPAQFTSALLGTTASTSASSTSGAVPSAKPQTYAFTMAFDGSYASVQRLMADLESYTRPMRVTAIKMSGSGSALNGTVDIETYYQEKATLPLAKENIK